MLNLICANLPLAKSGSLNLTTSPLLQFPSLVSRRCISLDSFFSFPSEKISRSSMPLFPLNYASQENGSSRRSRYRGMVTIVSASLIRVTAITPHVSVLNSLRKTVCSLQNCDSTKLLVPISSEHISEKRMRATVSSPPPLC